MDTLDKVLKETSTPNPENEHAASTPGQEAKHAASTPNDPKHAASTPGSTPKHAASTPSTPNSPGVLGQSKQAKGGRALAAKLTPEERSASARKARAAQLAKKSKPKFRYDGTGHRRWLFQPQPQKLTVAEAVAAIEARQQEIAAEAEARKRKPS